jgi:hypothetical protein
MNRQIVHHVISLSAILPLWAVLISWLKNGGVDVLPWGGSWLELWPMGLAALLAVFLVSVNSGFGIATCVRMRRES